MLIKRILNFSLKWIVFSLTLFFVLNIKKPLLFKIRNYEVELFFFLLVMSISIIFLSTMRNKKFKSIELIFFTFIIIFSVIIFTKNNFKYNNYRERVFNAESSQIKRIGRHFITGFTNKRFTEIKRLVEKGGLGGIYLTRRNFDGKNFFEIKELIDTLQKIQKDNGLPPLFITADQEGGIVSRVSPPLANLPALGNIVEKSDGFEKLERRLSIFANIQSSELFEIGINVNLSPVVDLKTSNQHNMNIHTRLDLRSISSNEQIVTDVAMIYSKIFEKNGVIPTLKHFPGLGGVTQDTHLIAGILDNDISELSVRDWLPFREISKNTGAFIMLGHVLLTSVDDKDLVSCSKKIIKGIIRDEWHHDGVLITDDLNMGSVVNSDGGISGASVKALNAGADLLLISYDGEQYYKAVCGLLDADKKGVLDLTMLEKSRKRLNKALEVISKRRDMYGRL